jgi:hypothetical protein
MLCGRNLGTKSDQMTFKSWQKRKTLNVRLLQPQLPLCAGKIDGLLSQILTAYFPEKVTSPGVFFGRIPTLAHIEDFKSEQRSSIWMHHALNDPATPDYVFSHVLKHELLHSRIQPREVKGEWLAHPPEFWEEENRIAEADKGRAWEWIYRNFYDALVQDTKHECIWVNNRRMKELIHNHHCAEPDLQYLCGAFKLKRRELRFGFRGQALRDFELDKDS